MSSFLKSLPDIFFTDLDPAGVEQAIFRAYETIAATTLHPGDPVRLFLEGLAYVIAQQNFIIDQTAKRNLLAYATGDYLDHLGALVDTSRLQAQPALTTLRFTLSGPLAFPVAIPAGTRVTPDGKIMFATSAYAEIASGATWVEVPAACVTPGAVGNGYVAGQINRLVDPVAYVANAANTTLSLGGSDVESDVNFRERIHLAPERFSVAGPRGSYYYYARSAHPDIVDVAVHSPEPGVVRVHPLLADAQAPSSEVLTAVADLVNDEGIRPLTDRVEVLPPEPVPFELVVAWYLSRDDATLAAQIQAAVGRAVSDYVVWQRSRLGRDITPSRLIAAVINAGAKRCEVESPPYTVLEPWQVGVASSVAVNFGGVEDR